MYIWYYTIRKTTHSDLVVNYKVPRLVIRRSERGNGTVWRGFAKPLPPKNSVKFKRQIKSKIRRKFAKKCLGASSLQIGSKDKCLDESSCA